MASKSPTAQKQNGPPFGGPFVFDFEPITEPVLAQGRALEPARVPGLVLVLVLVPERAQALVLVPERAQALVRLASSVQPARAPGPVCWPLAIRRVPGVRHFFRKHNKRQSPG
ncbi:hypothetical protein X740_20745 [Mesorhizobium sp. LNHC221B00]|uniref:hypothetical protein n=1 Tax=Mesorhizobium sp. LNHC221B00 TaxID=1287233 RepID=UPI0003CF46B3|nr:hypothetical protein [Mesorhizobium sp. LNHC221B00]ESY78458.1 hypothetical protein X740_20745 [Mesorhizobium sp. LNHC221B00]